MPEISVVVPTYNRLETLAPVLPTLLAQDLAPSEFEVLVCDSNSTDGTAEFLAKVHEEHPNVRHLPGAYSGRAAARNAGIDAAQGDVVLFNDSDIFASPDLLSQHLRHHRAQRNVAVVGLEVQVKDYADYLHKRDHPSERGSLHKPTRKKLPWLYFLTGNASVRREDLMRVGRFDESFTGYGHEDLELGYRLERAGVTILYEPNAINYHCQDVPHDDQKEKMRLAGTLDGALFSQTSRFFRATQFGDDARLPWAPQRARTSARSRFLFRCALGPFEICARSRATISLCIRRQRCPEGPHRWLNDMDAAHCARATPARPSS